MYESIMKVSTGDPNFKFKLRSTPFPPTSEVKYRMSSLNAGMIVFYTAISYGVILATIVSYIVVERKSGINICSRYRVCSCPHIGLEISSLTS